MFTDVIKKIKSFSIFMSATLLLTAIPSTITFAAPAEDTTMWQIVWHSQKIPSRVTNGIFVK